jgi:hypothetical protein
MPQKLISVKKALLIAVLCSVLVGSAIAAILLTRTITNTFRMLGQANFILVREDDLTTEVTSISWGDFLPLQSKDSQTILGTRICIKNLGNVPIVIGWNATGLDRDKYSITATWSGNPYPENDYNQFRIDPGYYNGYMVFTLTSLDPYSTPGDFNFVLNFNAQQAPS